jgi:hypothetical protein
LKNLNSLSLKIYHDSFELGNLNYFLDNINDWKKLKKLKFRRFFAHDEAELFLFIEHIIQYIKTNLNLR